MIIEHKTITLFDKLLFEKAVIIAPFNKPHPMPDEACFLYIMEGAYNSISEEEQLLIKKDEAVLMKCGNYLSQMRSSHPDRKYEAIAVHFFPEVLKKIYQNDLPKALISSDEEKPRTMVKVETSLLIQKYIESVLFYFENPDLVSEEILVLKLKEIILLLLQTENAAGILQIMSNLFNPREFAFKEIIEAHFFTPVTINELAALTNRSLSSFKRDFSKIYQASPARYLRKKKIDKALELLQLSKSSIGDIAFSCGFLDVAHFSKTFKSLTGMTPTEYKLSHSDKRMNKSA